MTSFQRRAIVLIPWLISACGITIPGGLKVGSDEPGVGAAAGSGAIGGFAGAAGAIPARGGAGGVSPVAGSGGIVAGTGGTAGSRVDRDGDGYDARSDCNDLNPGIHPGAPD